jgi:hypothetical protein
VEEDLPPLNKDDTKYIQAVTETLLYYGQTVVSTIVPVLSSIATKQAKATAKMKATVKQLLDYCALQEEEILTFKDSGMVLQVHSNAGYANKKITQPGRGTFFPIKQRHIPPPIMTQF